MLSAMFPHVVQIVRAGPSTPDDYGNPTPGWDAPSLTVVGDCSVQPDTTGETTLGRQTTTTGLRMWAPHGTDLRSTDRVVYNGDTYEVDGDVQPWDFEPLPHIEARLVRSESA